MLRKAVFADYPRYHLSTKPDGGEMRWIHLHHCIDMCTASTDLLTLTWMDYRDLPWPDFSVNHQCKDGDTVVKWQKDHAVNQTKFVNMPLPTDAFVWPAPWIDHESELGVKLGPFDFSGNAAPWESVYDSASHHNMQPSHHH